MTNFDLKAIDHWPGFVASECMGRYEDYYALLASKNAGCSAQYEDRAGPCGVEASGRNGGRAGVYWWHPPPPTGHSRPCDQLAVTGRESGPRVPVTLHRASSTVIISGTNARAECLRRSFPAAPLPVSPHEPRRACVVHFDVWRCGLSFQRQRTPWLSRHSSSHVEAVTLMFNWNDGLYLILAE